jgi:hypothetical protein
MNDHTNIHGDICICDECNENDIHERIREGGNMNAVILGEVAELVSRWGVEDVLSAFTQICREEADKYTVTNTQGVDMKANELKLYHEGFIERDTDCIQCGRPKSAMQGTMHNGWCSWCVRNRMEHRGYDSYGRSWTL